MNTYIEKNRGFITSSKLKEFLRCAYCYKLKYIDELPDPTEGDKDYFLVGQAFDDFITLGTVGFNAKYEIVNRRKEGSTKIQITQGMGDKMAALHNEFSANKLFVRPTQKFTFTLKGNPMPLRCELDDFDSTAAIIRDVKTTANLKTFDPLMYIDQMAFYQYVIEEITTEETGNGIRCGAQLEVVDKCDIAHSQRYDFTPSTLYASRELVLRHIAQLQAAHEMDFFPAPHDPLVMLDCPYYGHEGHGRPTQPIVL